MLTVRAGAGYTFWRNVQIIGGGFATGIVYNQNQSNVLYVRVNVGGPYRWNPITRQWIPLTDFIGLDQWQFAGVESLATDPANPDRLYSAVGSYTASWAGNGALLISTNRGNSWTQVNLSVKLGGNDVGHYTGERLQVDPNLPSTLFLGTTMNGLWKSSDSGATWNRVTSLSPTNLNFACLDPTSSLPGTMTQRIIVGVMDTANRIYVSTDGGGTWNAPAGQPMGLDPMRFALSPGVFYVSYGNASGQNPGSPTSGAVYKYNLGAGTWMNISPPTGSYGFGGVCVDKENTNCLLVGTVGRWYPKDELYRSTNGGASWKPIMSNAILDFSQAPYHQQYNPCWFSDVQINPFNRNQAVCLDGYGVLITENLTNADRGQPVTWSFEDLGIEETVVMDMASPPSGPSLYSAIMDEGGFRHDNIGVSPTNGTFRPAHGSNYAIDFAEQNPNLLVRCHSLAYGETGTYGSYSLDGGLTWSQFSTQPPGLTAPGSTSGGTIAIAADGSRIVWTPPGAGTFFSINHGTSWTASAGIAAGLKVVADRVNPAKFYAYDGANGVFYVSTNGGTNFAMTVTGLPTFPTGALYPGSVKAVFGNEGHLWLAGGDGGLYRSTNSGVSFVVVNTVAGANLVAFGKAAPSQNYPAVFIAGTIGGIYGLFRSDDQGADWTRVNDDQHQYGWIWSLAGDPKVYGRLYVGTSGRGVICGDMSPASPQIVLGAGSGTNFTIQTQSESGMDYVLEQATNLPSPATWIDLSTNAGTGSTLTIPVAVDLSSPSRFYRLKGQSPR
ncbi:MAG: carbohydrate-binding protein [Limisphaerales bacterium]